MSTSIEITDNVSPAMKALRTKYVPLALRAPVGEALVTLFQQNFLSLGTNKRGWPTTNFWARAAAATSYDLESGGVTINVDQVGVRQRYQGGAIFPTGGRKFLTIPACAEAYGKRAADFPGLKFAGVQTPSGTGLALVKPGTPTVSASDEPDGVMFWLSRGVHQEPDEAVLPDDSDIRETVMHAITAAVSSLN